MSIEINSKSVDVLLNQYSFSFKAFQSNLSNAAFSPMCSGHCECHCGLNHVLAYPNNGYSMDIPIRTESCAYISESSWMNVSWHDAGINNFDAEKSSLKKNSSATNLVNGYLLENKNRENIDNGGTTKIWRPFSPPPPSDVNIPQQNIAGQQDIMPGNKNIIFHIKPSNVKIGESKTSLFKAVNSRIRHSRGNSDFKSFRCEYMNCFKSFSRNEELTRHKRIHSGLKPFPCTICDKRFGRKDHLHKHLKTHLQVAEKKVHLCTVLGCGHRYTRSDALTRHKSTAHASHVDKERNASRKKRS